MKQTKRGSAGGFTLVELLVVIVIIAALAAALFSVGPRMMAKSKANQSMRNMRQIAPLLTAYAADHSMTLPAARGPVTLPDGTSEDLQWHEVCLSMLYPDADPADFKTREWWERSKPILRNPLLPESATPRGWTPLNPGYAMNEMLGVNLALVMNGGSGLDPLAMTIPLASIVDPGRTPLIAPNDNWHFRFDPAEVATVEHGTVKKLLIDGKMPVLFVDGHVETMSPDEYAEKQLHLMPMAPPI